jgi:hypothetical protein
MIGRNPYKVRYDVIHHMSSITSTSMLAASSEFIERAREEREILMASGAFRDDDLVLYTTEINAFGVVMGRERVEP